MDRAPALPVPFSHQHVRRPSSFGKLSSTCRMTLRVHMLTTCVATGEWREMAEPGRPHRQHTDRIRSRIPGLSKNFVVLELLRNDVCRRGARDSAYSDNRCAGLQQPWKLPERLVSAASCCALGKTCSNTDLAETPATGLFSFQPTFHGRSLWKIFSDIAISGCMGASN